jgi:hypothetical protein
VQAAGLPSGLPQLAVMVRRSALQSAELWAQWGVLLQRHHRPLITVTTVTGITATTVTDNTRVTTGEDITVLTADRRWRRPPRQMRPLGNEGQAPFLGLRPRPAGRNADTDADWRRRSATPIIWHGLPGIVLLFRLQHEHTDAWPYPAVCGGAPVRPDPAGGADGCAGDIGPIIFVLTTAPNGRSYGAGRDK